MAQIHVNDLTFSYDGSFDPIFEHVSFSIDTNWKLGFIGRNGKGKTTFLNLLQGKYSYNGTITTSTVFDYFPYTITSEQQRLPAADFLDALKPQCELWRVICELEELGESADLLYRPFQSLSPGEQTKLLLSVLFSSENHFLLIDEPTNHLDQEARACVTQYLASKKGFLLVSHDRILLDSCIDHILVLNRQTIEIQKGTFSSWWENKRRKDQFAEAENQKHKKELHKLTQAAQRTSQWANKNEQTKIGFDPIKEPERCISTRAYIGAKTKKLQRQVQNTEKRIQREIQEKEGLLVDLEVLADLKVMPLVHHKNTLLNIRDYSLKYPNSDHNLLSNLTFSLAQGERVALHGANGCGKSTLLHMVLQKSGVIEKLLPVAESGTFETASGLIISSVSQDTSKIKGSISDFCAEHNLDQSLFCSILRQLNLERAQFLKNIADYSEGQKKKVLLAASLLTPAHLYVWDEPLNYIDVFSRMQIEDLLLKYQPTMLFVEHDSTFRDKIATKTIFL